MIRSMLISMCVIGSLTGSPTMIASSAGMPTEVERNWTKVYSFVRSANQKQESEDKE